MACETKVIADSCNPDNDRITSVFVRYWRAIHGEVMTHRRFSRNASSSRAIPVKRMLAQVIKDPAGPIHWGANRPGMQAKDQLTGWRLRVAKILWRSAAFFAAAHSWAMMKVGLHKQVANRVTEPYQYINVLITSTEWSNFMSLRDHPDAQPEIAELAREIKKAMAASTPKPIWWGQWHLPYVSTEDQTRWGLLDSLKVSTARNARTSYMTFDGKLSTLDSDVKLHDQLVVAEPLHASPAEHCAKAEKGVHRNLHGFKPYRVYLETGERP